MDGVIIPNVEGICNKLGIDYNKITNYNIDKCKQLSDKEKASIKAHFSDISLIRNFGAVLGTQRLSEVSELYEVCFHSMCPDNDNAEYKKELIREYLPDIADKNIKLEMFNSFEKVFEETDILVEDCLENLLANIGRFRIGYLIDAPYNQCDLSKYPSIKRVESLDKLMWALLDKKYVNIYENKTSMVVYDYPSNRLKVVDKDDYYIDESEMINEKMLFESERDIKAVIVTKVIEFKETSEKKGLKVYRVRLIDGVECSYDRVMIDEDLEDYRNKGYTVFKWDVVPLEVNKTGYYKVEADLLEGTRLDSDTIENIGEYSNRVEHVDGDDELLIYNGSYVRIRNDALCNWDFSEEMGGVHKLDNCVVLGGIDCKILPLSKKPIKDYKSYEIKQNILGNAVKVIGNALLVKMFNGKVLNVPDELESVSIAGTNVNHIKAYKVHDVDFGINRGSSSVLEVEKYSDDLPMIAYSSNIHATGLRGIIVNDLSSIPDDKLIRMILCERDVELRNFYNRLSKEQLELIRGYMSACEAICLDRGSKFYSLNDHALYVVKKSLLNLYRTYRLLYNRNILPKEFGSLNYNNDNWIEEIDACNVIKSGKAYVGDLKKLVEDGRAIEVYTKNDYLGTMISYFVKGTPEADKGYGFLHIGYEYVTYNPDDKRFDFKEFLKLQY